MPTDRSDLDPIEPAQAQQLYLDHKATEYAPSTVQAHRYRLNHLVRWCDLNGLDNLNDLTGRQLQEYRLWRKEDGELAPLTLNQQMSTVRVFLDWCASIEAVPSELYDKVLVPRVRPENEQRDETLTEESAQTILAHLRKYEYASSEHAVFTLLWVTGIRLGAAHSLDIRDVDLEADTISLIHRPEEGTRLKNGAGGERPIAITPELSSLLTDYLDTTRESITDEHDREPFFTTSYGRMHRSTIRGIVYRVTAPCYRGEPCPKCTGASERKCPEAVSPHAIRRGSITHFLSNDVPVEIVGDRMDVTRDVLDKHYDKRSESVKLEQRRGYLSNV